MNEIYIEELKNFGCDFNTVMQRLSNDKILYKMLLEELIKSNEFGELSEALSNKSYTIAYEKAHTLKGVLGNLGISCMYDLICNILDTLKKNITGNLDSDCTKLIAEFNELKIIVQTNM